MGNPDQELTQTKRTLSKLVRKVHETQDRHQRTKHVRLLAEGLLDLREMFTTPDGTPDLTGRTWAYRDAVREIFSMSGIPREEVVRLQALTRYHTGNIIRERMGVDELEDFGLLPASPLERSASLRNERMHLVRSARGQDSDLSPDTALAMVEQLLRRVRAANLNDMDRGQLLEFLDRLGEVSHQVERVTKLANREQHLTDV